MQADAKFVKSFLSGAVSQQMPFQMQGLVQLLKFEVACTTKRWVVILCNSILHVVYAFRPLLEAWIACTTKGRIKDCPGFIASLYFFKQL